MPRTHNRIQRSIGKARFGILLGSVVLLGTGCSEAGDFLHGLFFGTDMPRYGNEALEEIQEQLSWIEQARRAFGMGDTPQQPGAQDQDYPPITLPTFSEEAGDKPTEQRLDTSAEFTIEGPGVATTPPDSKKNEPGSPAPTERLPGIYGETRRLRVIMYQGHYVEESEVVAKTEAGCPVPHWHAKNRIQVRTVEGIEFPDTGGCAFGKVSENPVQEVAIPLNIINSARVVN